LDGLKLHSRPISLPEGFCCGHQRQTAVMTPKPSKYHYIMDATFSQKSRITSVGISQMH
jgi:hypothetical protein